MTRSGSGDAPGPGPVQQECGFSVIVPVFNEASVLRAFVDRLRSGLPATGIEVIFACNGCTDSSADLLRAVDDPRFHVLVLGQACKSAAIRAAESIASLLPRFYVDADVLVEGRTLAALAGLLRDERFELVSPRVVYDETGMSSAAARIHRVWHSLPHVVEEGHHYVLGVSKIGRSRWGEFPDLLGDDSFIQSCVPRERCMIVQDMVVTTRPARTFWSFVRVRERWLRGADEMRRSGIEPTRTRGQRRDLLRRSLNGEALDVMAYLAARITASALAVVRSRSAKRWYHDRTTRG